MKISRTPSRALSALAVGTAAVSLLAGALAAPAQAASYDPAPGKTGASWLAGQTSKGVVHNAQYDFDDYGLSVDVALGLDAAGRQDAVVRAITKTVAKHVDDYTGSGSNLYAGATAKALSLALARGKDPRSFGGVDLVAQLEGRVASTAPIAGRIQDAFDPADPYGADYANVIGQAYAASGLTLAKSAKAGSATAFLLQQQCAKGFFRLGLTADPTKADQSCDGAAKADRAANTDATAIAVLALQDAKGAAAKVAVKKAVAWLVDRQLVNGSFGGGTSTETPNTNSTGLAGWALGAAGATKPAALAATWVRTLQVSAANPCTGELDREVGAVAYDDDGYDAGRRQGIKTKTSDQWRRASSQALPVLRWAPTASGSLTATPSATSVAAGSTFAIRLTGVAPGQRACLVGGGKAVEYLPGRNALSKLTVDVSSTTGSRTYRVYVGDAVRTVTVRVTT